MKTIFKISTLSLFYLMFTTSCTTSNDTTQSGNDTIQDVVAEVEDKTKRPSPLVTITTELTGKKIQLEYGSPSVKGRNVWGELVPYNEVWRTGANEATVINFDKELSFNGNVIAPGKYALFTIPTEGEWRFILNKEWDQWGAYKYDESLNVLNIGIMPTKDATFTESLTFKIENNQLQFNWEKLQFAIALK
jgi:hypothetical protein